MTVPLLLLLAAPAWAVIGRVVDAVSREPLARVSVRVLDGELQTSTDGAGRFELAVDSGELQVSSVGYRPMRVRIEPGQELEIALAPGTLRRTETVDVAAGPYAVEGGEGTALSLAGNELRNLASVLADDPLRAVQGLPGVASNDDFQSQLSLRGTGFRRIGIYTDGILLHSPYHTVQADPSAASLTVLSADVLESAVLHSGAPPSQFGDRGAAALDLRLRDGERKKFSGRGSASASNASILLEGPLSARRRGSWLVSARKSYLQYLINISSDEPSIAFAFSDVQARLTQDLSRGHSLTLTAIDGNSGLDRAGAEQQLGLNTTFTSDYHFTIGALRSRWTPRGSVLLENTVALIRERHLNRNRETAPLAGGHYGEWVYNSENRWQWSESAFLLFGASMRRLRDNGFLDRRVTGPPFAIRLDGHDGTGLRSGAFVAQQFAAWRGRVQLRGGGRVDGHSTGGPTAVSPTASATVMVLPSTHLHFQWGHYVQYPELSHFYSRFGPRALAPERAIHAQAGIEQRLGARTRLRAEIYQRLDRDLLFRPLLEPRLVAGRIYAGDAAAPILNSQRGYARGAQFFLQRRTSNGLTGWVSYAYGVARTREGPADFDQRHTANLFLSYRLRPTVNVSSRWTYGSGFPVQGYFRGTNPFALSDERNQVRLPAHHRLDARLNKTFVRRGWHITLFAEVINVYNRRNVRFDGVGGIDGRTGAVRLRFDTMFPVLPSGGVAIEW